MNSADTDNHELRRKRIHSGTGEDNRTPFQKDRDRILYTPAFRRLAGVAQVVHVNTERGYHNRLTHSLKVAQVGRRLAENLNDETTDREITNAGGLDPNVVETACLAHDLGHPPFGHPAEDALQDQLKQKDVISSFEGNPQSFRIVNNVSINKQQYGDNHSGLNLTLASLNAILKYPWSRGTTGKRRKKWGHYKTEEDEFEATRKLRTPGAAGDNLSLEAKIMDWADDLTYAIHDVADFYEAGLIPLDRLVRDTNEREEFVAEFEDEHDTDCPNWDATGFLCEFLPNLAEVAGSGSESRRRSPIDSPFEGSSYDIAGLSFMSSQLVERYLGLNKGHKLRVDPGVRGGLDIEDSLQNEIDLLQYLTEYYVFDDTALLAQQRGHKEAIKELFGVLYDATADGAEYAGMIPKPFDEKIELIHSGGLGYENIGPETLRARVTADIIASMTEQQTMQLYERIVGQSPGLITDQIV